MTRDFRYTTKKGHTLAITLYGEPSFGEHPCLLYLHGFKGFKDWGFVPYVGSYFAKRGFSFVTFNFSHNGIGPDGQTFTELEAFKNNTFSLELSETEELIHLLAHTDFFGRYLNQPLGLIGHSRGGGLSILTGSKSRDVKAVASWAAVSRFDRYPKADRQLWRKQGYLEVLNSRTQQVLQLGEEMLDDIEKNAKGSLNILQAAREIKKPLLILHGGSDESVPYYEAEELNIFGDPNLTRMQLIPETGHTFGASHPFAGTTPALEQVLDSTYQFFSEHLSR